jgi:signal peptidase II
MEKTNKILLFFAISTAVILTDQTVKFIVRHKLTEGVSVKAIGNVVYFTYVKNRGAAFGMFQGGRWILAAISLAVAIFMLFELKFFLINKPILVGGALLFGGIIGNLLDRVFLGFVTDFIDFRFWPVFNIADSCIDIGLLIIVIYLLFYDKKNSFG